VEQRRSKRFELSLPLTIRKSGSNADVANCETRNLSSRGVLFASSVRLEVGQVLEYRIALPTPGGGNLVLHCLGKVMRLEDCAEAGGDPGRPFRMAATIERYEFVRD
jgi:hypothetical protein